MHYIIGDARHGPARNQAQARAPREAQPGVPADAIAPARLPHDITAFVEIDHQANDLAYVMGLRNFFVFFGAVVGASAAPTIDEMLEDNKNAGVFTGAVLAGGIAGWALTRGVSLVINWSGRRVEEQVGLWTLEPQAQLARIAERAEAASPLNAEGMRACLDKMQRIFNLYPEMGIAALTTRLASLGRLVRTSLRSGITPHTTVMRGAVDQLQTVASKLTQLHLLGRISQQAMEDALIELAGHLGQDTHLIEPEAEAFSDILTQAANVTLGSDHPDIARARSAAFQARLDATPKFTPHPRTRASRERERAQQLADGDQAEVVLHLAHERKAGGSLRDAPVLHRQPAHGRWHGTPMNHAQGVDAGTTLDNDPERLVIL